MKRKSHCQQCGRYDTIAGRISKRGLCSDCATANMQANARALSEKTGPAYNLWARRQRQGLDRYQRTLQAQLDAQWKRLEQNQSPAE